MENAHLIPPSRHLSLVRHGRRLLAFVPGVRPGDDAAHNEKKHNRADEEADERGLHVGAVRGVVAHVGGGGVEKGYETRTELMTSFFCSFFITSSPVVIWPKTVWTPFK